MLQGYASAAGQKHMHKGTQAHGAELRRHQSLPKLASELPTTRGLRGRNAELIGCLRRGTTLAKSHVVPSLEPTHPCSLARAIVLIAFRLTHDPHDDQDPQGKRVIGS